jgi:hypothetical protein
MGQRKDQLRLTLPSACVDEQHAQVVESKGMIQTSLAIVGNATTDFIQT